MVSQKNRMDLNAIVPDQLGHYVKAVAGLDPHALNGFPFYLDSGHGVLAAFGAGGAEELAEAVEQALRFPGLREITVLAESVPPQAPETANVSRDNHWILNLPAAPGQKTRNMLARARRCLRLETGSGPEFVTEAHALLAREFCERKENSLDDASRYIFGKMRDYAASSRNVSVFSAWADFGLAGFTLADYSALAYPFYMFAFRSPKAPPGTADFLLQAIMAQAEALGYEKLNLGLGINPGIEFFKKKWGATPAFPHVETTWRIARPRGILARMAGKLFGKK